LADEERRNFVYVKASESGRSYARGIPADSSGSKGETRVYSVSKEGDTLDAVYPWYSQRGVYLYETSGIAIVRRGPWARGNKASRDDLAIGFYLNGKLLKEYSTLDIAGSEEKVSRSKSHYEVFKEAVGFRWFDRNTIVFECETVDDRKLLFDLRTGEIQK
jgi:hypothetical protein